MSETYEKIIGFACGRILLLAITLTLLTFVLHGSILSASWRWHDAQILLHLHKYPLLADFINPAVWQEYSPVNLTPWGIVAYEFDYRLFGLEPMAFQVRHLLSLALVAVSFYLLLTLWIPRAFAIIGPLLFLVGSPVFHVAEQLMTRHYVEGMLFCLLSLYLFVRALRENRPGLTVLSACFYLLAVSAKEIYVPLVVLLIFLPETTLRTRLRCMLPHIAVALLYVVWRKSMLQSAIGGYSDASSYLTIPFLLTAAQKLLRIPLMLMGQWWLYACLICLAIAGWAAALQWRRLPVWVVLCGLVIGPLIPLAGAPGFEAPDRYLFLVWLVTSALLAFSLSVVYEWNQARPGAHNVAGIAVPLAGTALLLIFCVLSGLQVRNRLMIIADEFDVQTRFIWSRNDSVAFVPSQSLRQDYWSVTDLSELKQRVTGTAAPRPIPDDLFLDSWVTNLYEYDPGCHCMQDISAQVPQRLTRFAQRNRPEAPLSVDYHYDNGLFSWNFGPYQSGEYHVVSPVMGVLPVPAKMERLRISVKDGTPFYIRYSSPEGWVSYSDRLLVDIGKAGSWRRRH